MTGGKFIAEGILNGSGPPARLCFGEWSHLPPGLLPLPPIPVPVPGLSPSWSPRHVISDPGPQSHPEPATLAPTSRSCPRSCISLPLAFLPLDPIASHPATDATLLTPKCNRSSPRASPWEVPLP